MNFVPRNILVIDFGQLGDVVLSLPALRAIRERFPDSRITVAVGLPTVPILELSGYADVTLGVDRVELRDGPKLRSIMNISRLVKEVRLRRFDFVIDLHSLSETNLLGYLSGARLRLFGQRPGRSINFLSNFKPKPPVEDAGKHAVDRYLDVVAPLGIENVHRVPQLTPRDEDTQTIKEMLSRENAVYSQLVGLFPGSGQHTSKRWPLERFQNLAERLVSDDLVRIVLFAGPEERELVEKMRAAFPPQTIIFDRLNIPQLAAALALLTCFVSNSTGPMHIAAATGTPVVMLLPSLTPDSFTPVGEGHRIIFSRSLNELEVEEVYEVTRAVVASERLCSAPAR
ncbi:MAG TPA: glycosyltransferase family 9 protein [Pyrinomonadaceae bacterium]|nr:glycosyltransferase family 9 protein [Pyrinomonadaceae bacterium]